MSKPSASVRLTSQGVAIAVVVAACATIQAHHSLTGVYDTRQRVTIEGAVVEFSFVNPHPFLTVDVTPSSGPPERWRLELDNRSELAAIGMSAASFTTGEQLIASGSPSHARDHRLYTRRIDRPQDGFWYEQVGSSPRTGTTPAARPR